MNNNFNENDMLFAYKMMGIKEIPYNTQLLLINNSVENTLDINYKLDINATENSVIRIPKSNISNITFKKEIKMQNNHQPTKSYELKSMLISTALFAGNPILQVGGAKFINSMLDSSQYDKIKYDSYYEIEIKLDNMETSSIIVTSDNSPEAFIEEFKK